MPTYFWDKSDAIRNVDKDVSSGVKMAGNTAQKGDAKEVAHGEAAHGHASTNFETHLGILGPVIYNHFISYIDAISWSVCHC